VNNPGVIKEIDRLGRLVIPKSMRKRYNLEDRVEVIATEDGVLVRNPKYKLIDIENKEKKE
jgi:AbrB family looped-hinge helix DNA binding protein